MEYTNLSISNSILERNEARSNGGAIFSNGGSHLYLAATNLTRNSAKEGGAIYTTMLSTVLRDCQFSRNRARFGGACVFSDLSYVQATRVLFDENQANQQQGGAIATSNRSTIWVNDSTFQNNNASDNGGVIAADEGCYIRFTNVIFVNNTAGVYGGSVYAYNGTTVIVLHSSFSSTFQTF